MKSPCGAVTTGHGLRKNKTRPDEIGLERRCRGMETCERDVHRKVLYQQTPWVGNINPGREGMKRAHHEGPTAKEKCALGNGKNSGP